MSLGIVKPQGKARLTGNDITWVIRFSQQASRAISGLETSPSGAFCHALGPKSLTVLQKEGLKRPASNPEGVKQKCPSIDLLDSKIPMDPSLTAVPFSDRQVFTHLALALGSHVIHFFHIDKLYIIARHRGPDMACI